MANIKISALPVFTDASGLDKIPVVDVSAGDTKAYTIEQVLSGNYTIAGDKVYTGTASWNTTDAIKIPNGDNSERPSVGENGMIRYNTENSQYEFFKETQWLSPILLGSNVNAIQIPVGSTGQRPIPASTGYFRYNNTLNIFEGYSNGTWGQVGGGQMYGNAQTKVISYNAKTLDENITILGTHNASAIGPIEVANTATITVQDGATFVVI